MGDSLWGRGYQGRGYSQLKSAQNVIVLDHGSLPMIDMTPPAVAVPRERRVTSSMSFIFSNLSLDKMAACTAVRCTVCIWGQPWTEIVTVRIGFGLNMIRIRIG